MEHRKGSHFLLVSGECSEEKDTMEEKQGGRRETREEEMGKRRGSKMSL